MSKKLTDDLRVHGEDYLDSVTVPQDDSVAGNVLALGKGGQNNSFAVKVVVDTAITLTASKTLTIAVKSSSDKSTWSTIASKEFTAGQVAGTVLMYLSLPPNVDEFTRVDVSTDDDAATGKVSAYPVYIPR